ncbi:uncharacterized protein LOC132052248 [Lycium ferocissimum]|uniref:uncharacterized protein LOC132052248 n=1 Tax=Lycium ferocissimum TaxID=112874 RepID=UPI0028152471|nr:uncharacterized protein LOC132052248 [Lycium ferocissimum]
MSSLMSSQGIVLATAMAVSAGTVILFDLLGEKYIETAKLELAKNVQNSPHKKHSLKSCLSSGEKKKDSRKKKSKKRRVHFAADVKDSNGNSEEYRREHYRSSSNCYGNKILGMPSNR